MVTAHVRQPSCEPHGSCGGELQGAVMEVDMPHAGLLRQAEHGYGWEYTVREMAHLPGSSAGRAGGKDVSPQRDAGLQHPSVPCCSLGHVLQPALPAVLGPPAPSQGAQPRTGTSAPFLCLLDTTCPWGLQADVRQHSLCAHRGSVHPDELSRWPGQWEAALVPAGGGDALPLPLQPTSMRSPSWRRSWPG